jgi:hypothetical protein
MVSIEFPDQRLPVDVTTARSVFSLDPSKSASVMLF